MTQWSGLVSQARETNIQGKNLTQEQWQQLALYIWFPSRVLNAELETQLLVTKILRNVYVP